MKPLQTLCLILCATTLFSGCSYAMINPAPPKTQWESATLATTCTDEAFPAYIDFYMGVSGLIAPLITSALLSGGPLSSSSNESALLIPSFVMGGLGLASGIYGVTKTRECKEFIGFRNHVHQHGEPPYPTQEGPPQNPEEEDGSEDDEDEE